MNNPNRGGTFAPLFGRCPPGAMRDCADSFACAGRPTRPQSWRSKKGTLEIAASMTENSGSVERPL